jgi:hypothetical protein
VRNVNLHHLVQSKFKIGEIQSVLKELDVISFLEKAERIVYIGHMLDSLIEAYVQFMVLQMELQKVLNQELRCLCSKNTTVLSECTVPKTVDVSLLHTQCIINKYICTKMYIYCIYSRYILYRSVCPLVV